VQHLEVLADKSLFFRMFSKVRKKGKVKFLVQLYKSIKISK